MKFYFIRSPNLPKIFHYTYSHDKNIFIERVIIVHVLYLRKKFKGGFTNMNLNSEEGFTGLEAAIVLIAFIVVASVFSYAVLGAGFYTTSKTQEVIYSAVDSAGSTPQLMGNVYGIRDSDGEHLHGVLYSVVLSSGGKYIDFSALDVTWSTSTAVTSIPANSPLIVEHRNDVAAGRWGICGIKPDSAADDIFLEPNEIFTIYVNPNSSDEVSAGQRFNIEMKSPRSGAFSISRTCPDQFDPITVL